MQHPAAVLWGVVWTAEAHPDSGLPHTLGNAATGRLSPSLSFSFFMLAAAAGGQTVIHVALLSTTTALCRELEFTAAPSTAKNLGAALSNARDSPSENFLRLEA